MSFFGFLPLIGEGVKTIGDYLGKREDRKATREANQKNYEMQKEFAQNSIRWKVQDAQSAGIHPLAALGSQPYQAQASFNADTSGGDFSRNMGQNIARAIDAKATQEERRLNIERAREAVKGDKLRNLLLASELRTNLGQQPPPTPAVQPQPATPTRSGAGTPNAVAGSAPSGQWVRDPDGGFSYYPSSDVKNLMEDNVVLETRWQIENLLFPFLDSATRRKPYLPPPDLKTNPLPNGWYYRWDGKRQKYYPTNPNEGRYISPGR